MIHTQEQSDIHNKTYIINTDIQIKVMDTSKFNKKNMLN